MFLVIDLGFEFVEGHIYGRVKLREGTGGSVASHDLGKGAKRFLGGEFHRFVVPFSLDHIGL
jgi:hypothetical protein